MAFAALLGILLIVLLAGVPIAYAIGGLAVIGNQWFGATSFTRLAETQFSSINSFVVMAIPFFILAGNVMLEGKMARSLFDFMSALTRWITGRRGDRRHRRVRPVRRLDRLVGGRCRGALAGRRPGADASRLPAAVRVRTDGRRRHARHHDPAVGRLRRLRRAHEHLSRLAIPRRRDSRLGARGDPRRHMLRAGAPRTLRRAAAVPARRGVAHLQGRPAVALHARDRARRHLHRPLHADRGGGGQRRLRRARDALRLPHPALERPAARHHRLGEELGGRPHHPCGLARHRPAGLVPGRRRTSWPTR